MHCPKCGQQQISEETRFCSRCGLLLTGVAEVVANSGIVPAQTTGLMGSATSPRRRGVKQGGFVFLLTFLVVPILIVISIMLNLKPAVFPMLAMFLLGVGGLLRIAYALMFESGVGASTFLPDALPSGTDIRGALPSSQTIAASVYASPSSGSQRDTNDLQREPGSVTDNTTKLLERESDS